MLGGEVFDENVAFRLRSLFQHATIRSVYAASECGSILVSDEAGIFVMNRRDSRVRIVNDVFVIVKSDGRTFVTGDQCRIIKETPEEVHFKIVGRDSRTINVGGIKANLDEVETVVLSGPGVDDGILKSQPNSVLGQVVVAKLKVSKSFEEKTFYSFLDGRIAKAIQPMRIEYVKNVLYGYTGKKRHR